MLTSNSDLQTKTYNIYNGKQDGLYDGSLESLTTINVT